MVGTWKYNLRKLSLKNYFHEIVGMLESQIDNNSISTVSLWPPTISWAYIKEVNKWTWTENTNVKAYQILHSNWDLTTYISSLNLNLTLNLHYYWSMMSMVTTCSFKNIFSINHLTCTWHVDPLINPNSPCTICNIQLSLYGNHMSLGT